MNLNNLDVIYLHGFASSPSSKKAAFFKEQFNKLSIPLTIPDLQGGNFEELTISSQIKVVQSILSSRPGRKFVLIGSSMGGYLAALLAQMNIEVIGLYLMAPGFNFLDRWKKSLANSSSEKFCFPKYIDVFHYGVDKNVRLNTNIFIDAEKWEDKSFSRKLPTRIVHGLHDDTVEIEVSRQYVKRQTWCSLKEIDSDHSLISHIKWIVKDCQEFLEKVKEEEFK
ncbi:MAG: alpha/beta hydrolase [Nitrospinales bacterium]